jgi:streptomycin 6-kinase
VNVLTGKATPAELAEFKQFVLAVAGRVASAHREDGQAVSPAEHAAIEQITQALDASMSDFTPP